MKIRKASPADWESIKTVYETARDYMKRSGNPDQWGDTEPKEQVLLDDISEGRLYVVYDDDDPGDTILGSFACIAGKDPTYTYIEGGEWLNDEPYLTLHRVAGAGIKKGVFRCIMEDTMKKTRNIRIDTHKDNLTMQHLVTKHGFTYCGIIYLLNGKPRMAYQYARSD